MEEEARGGGMEDARGEEEMEEADREEEEEDGRKRWRGKEEGEEEGEGRRKRWRRRGGGGEGRRKRGEEEQTHNIFIFNHLLREKIILKDDHILVNTTEQTRRVIPGQALTKSSLQVD